MAKIVNGTEAAILTALTSGELFGSALLAKVHEVTDGRLKLTLGTLYPTLYRMEEKGLIKARWTDDGGRSKLAARRRHYRITGEGQRALDALSTILRHRVALGGSHA